MSFTRVAVTWRDVQESVRFLAEAVNRLGDGRSNATGSVTLTANQASTVVTERRVGTDSVINFMPTTANAAAEVGAGTMYVSAVTSGSYTITHANNAQTDRDFTYSVQG